MHACCLLLAALRRTRDYYRRRGHAGRRREGREGKGREGRPAIDRGGGVAMNGSSLSKVRYITKLLYAFFFFFFFFFCEVGSAVVAEEGVPYRFGARSQPRLKVYVCLMRSSGIQCLPARAVRARKVEFALLCGYVALSFFVDR